MSLSTQNYKEPNPYLEFWLQFKQNRGALLGLLLTIVFAIIALSAQFLAPYDPSMVFPDSFNIPPSWYEAGSSRFLLGTDDLGRDLLSRLLYGARISMGVGFLVVIFSTLFGTAIGLLAGYMGGMMDRFIMRCIDILMSLPSILLAIVIVAILGPGLFNAIIAVSIVSIPGVVRLVRATAMSEKVKDYVTASRTYGAGHIRLAIIHVFPNCLAPLIVQMTLGFSDGILNTAALGFLGLGAQAPTAEWGTMLSDARAFIELSPWLVTLPGLCILLVVLGFNILGDGLRDALDPRLRK